MREIARVHPRFLGLLFGMREQRVDLIDQWLDFERERIGNPVRAVGAHGLDCVAHAPERRKTVPALQHRHRQQAKRQGGKAPDEDRANPRNLVVEFAARRGNREGPARVAIGQDHGPFDDPQGVVLELVRIVEMRLVVDVVALDRQAAIPQAAAGKRLAPLTGDLPIDAAIGFEKALVAERAVELHIAEAVDLGRGNQRGLHIFELLVEIVLDQPHQRAVERKAAAQQQHADP